MATQVRPALTSQGQWGIHYEDGGHLRPGSVVTVVTKQGKTFPVRIVEEDLMNDHAGVYITERVKGRK